MGRTAYPRRGSLVLVFGSLLVLVNGYCGLRQIMDGWPCACYPTLADLVPPQAEELAVEVERVDGSWQGVPLQPMEEFLPWTRFHRTELALLSDPARLPAFWTVLRSTVSDPEDIRSVRFFATLVSTVPEDRDAPPLQRRLLLILDPAH